MIVFPVIQKTCIHISVTFNTMYGPIKRLSYYILVQILTIISNTHFKFL